eukprot:6189899-Pleurochrysis_carterae.AAC.4
MFCQRCGSHTPMYEERDKRKPRQRRLRGYQRRLLGMSQFEYSIVELVAAAAVVHCAALHGSF